MYKIISTFTGAGGLDIGFHGDFEYLGDQYKKLKFYTDIASDINRDACNTLEADNKYFNNTKVLHEDILQFDYNKIPNNNFFPRKKKKENFAKRYNYIRLGCWWKVNSSPSL